MVVLLWVLGIVGIIGALAMFVQNADKNNIKKFGAIKYVPAVFGIVFIMIAMFLVSVGPQDVFVTVTPQGISQEPLETGWHLVPPWYSVEQMDRTVWVYTFSNKQAEGQQKGPDAIWVPTKDGIKMGMNVSISWSIDPAYAPWILQNVSEADGGEESRYLWMEENFIRPKAQSSIALVVSEYSPIEVYSAGRQKIQAEVYARLSKELLLYHLILHQVDIREVFYNPEYEQAINNKKLAEQEVMRLAEVTKQKQEQLKQSSIDKDIAIQRAEGESRALQIKGQSISNNPRIIELEWINKWNGALPTYMMGNGHGVMLNMGGKQAAGLQGSN